MPKFGWGLRPVRLDDGTLVNELVPVTLEVEVKRKHRPTEQRRGRPEGMKGTKGGYNGWRDYRDWRIARVVEGGMALGLSHEVSVGMAAMDVRVSAPTVERALRRIRAAKRASGSRLTSADMKVSPLFENIPFESLDPPADDDEIRLLHKRYEES
jgi:hypothetical protein